MASKKSKPAKKAAAPKKKAAAPKKKVAPKKIAPQKKTAAKKKTGPRKPAASQAMRIVAAGFRVVCDQDGVIGTFPDRDAANACKDAHLAQKKNKDHGVVVEGFQG
jgi:hypothetical protein